MKRNTLNKLKALNNRLIQLEDLWLKSSDDDRQKIDKKRNELNSEIIYVYECCKMEEALTNSK